LEGELALDQEITSSIGPKKYYMSLEKYQAKNEIREGK
jgi:hypothetical protein